MKDREIKDGRGNVEEKEIISKEESEENEKQACAC
jgi:hypothetical protein